jgi:hypothetical protein
MVIATPGVMPRVAYGCANSSMSIFPEVERSRVVLDNLSTHTTAALYASLPMGLVSTTSFLLAILRNIAD